jgi:hypothetical protein
VAARNARRLALARGRARTMYLRRIALAKRRAYLLRRRAALAKRRHLAAIRAK